MIFPPWACARKAVSCLFQCGTGLSRQNPCLTQLSNRSKHLRMQGLEWHEFTLCSAAACACPCAACCDNIPQRCLRKNESRFALVTSATHSVGVMAARKQTQHKRQSLRPSTNKLLVDASGLFLAASSPETTTIKCSEGKED